jgi:hypothetical protein
LLAKFQVLEPKVAMEFDRKKVAAVNLGVYRCGKSAWQMFRNYLYLNGRAYHQPQGAMLQFIKQANSICVARSYYPHETPIRVSRLVVLPDYQGKGALVKRLLNLSLNSTSLTKPTYILTSNPKIMRCNMKGWEIARFRHASKGKGDSKINAKLKGSLTETE